MAETNSSKKAQSLETIVTHTGRHPEQHWGYVNTPVYRGSTIVFPTLDSLESTEPRFDYGRTGNPSSAAVEERSQPFGMLRSLASAAASRGCC